MIRGWTWGNFSQTRPQLGPRKYDLNLNMAQKWLILTNGSVIYYSNYMHEFKGTVFLHILTKCNYVVFNMVFKEKKRYI